MHPERFIYHAYNEETWVHGDFERYRFEPDGLTLIDLRYPSRVEFAGTIGQDKLDASAGMADVGEK